MSLQAWNSPNKVHCGLGSWINPAAIIQWKHIAQGNGKRKMKQARAEWSCHYVSRDSTGFELQQGVISITTGFSFSSLARRLLWYSWNIPTITWASAEIRVQVEDSLSSSDLCFFPSHLSSYGSCPHLGLTPSSRMEWKGHFMATSPGLWSWTSGSPWVCFTACTQLGGSWRSMWQLEPNWTPTLGAVYNQWWWTKMH